jgi:hypothetical protein
MVNTKKRFLRAQKYDYFLIFNEFFEKKLSEVPQRHCITPAELRKVPFGVLRTLNAVIL